MNIIPYNEKRIIFASALGNTLEYYDFTLYGLLCPLLSKFFFPQEDISLSIFMGLSLYAIGFLARPIGGVLFGYCGDRFGRKNALSTSILLMSLSCFIIGVLPTYQQIGISAAILLSIARFFQGICVGGEYSGAVIFSLEHSSSQQMKNFSGALLAASSHCGCLLAALVAAFFSYTQSMEIAWRIPFLIGSFIGLGGFYLRLKLPETPIFLETQNHTSLSQPKIFGTLFNKYKKELLCSVAFISVSSVNAGFSTAFLGLLYTQEFSFELHQALLIVSFGLVFYIMSSLFTSYLLRFFKATNLITGSGILLALFSIFIMAGLTSSHLWVILVFQIIFSCLSGVFWGSINPVICDFFSPTIRYLGVALSDTLARTIFGGTAPMVFLFLKGYFGNYFVIGMYLSFLCVVSTVFCLFVAAKRRETTKNE